MGLLYHLMNSFTSMITSPEIRRNSYDANASRSNLFDFIPRGFHRVVRHGRASRAFEITVVHAYETNDFRRVDYELSTVDEKSVGKFASSAAAKRTRCNVLLLLAHYTPLSTTRANNRNPIKAAIGESRNSGGGDGGVQWFPI